MQPSAQDLLHHLNGAVLPHIPLHVLIFPSLSIPSLPPWPAKRAEEPSFVPELPAGSAVVRLRTAICSSQMSYVRKAAYLGGLT